MFFPKPLYTLLSYIFSGDDLFVAKLLPVLYEVLKTLGIEIISIFERDRQRERERNLQKIAEYTEHVFKCSNRLYLKESF